MHSRLVVEPWIRPQLRYALRKLAASRRCGFLRLGDIGLADFVAQQELLAQSFRTTPAGNAVVVNGEPRENRGIRSQRRDVVHKKQVPRPLPCKASNDRILVDVWCQVRHALREQEEKDCQNERYAVCLDDAGRKELT